MSVAEYFTQAKKQVEQQQWQDASKSFQKIIDLEPNRWDANFNLGQVLCKQQRYEEAMIAYKKVIEVNRNYSWSYNNLGIILLHLKKTQKAIKFFSQAIKLEEENPWFYRNLARAFVRQGDEAQALNCLKKSVQLQPNSPDLQVELGESLKKHNDLKEAVNCFCRALRLNPNYLPAYTALKFTQLESAWLEKVIGFYQKILEQNPDLVPALNNLADLLTQQQKLKEAKVYYRKSIYKKTVALNPELVKLDWRSPKQQAPDFLIIGAGKCGTTSLYSYLDNHPQILLPNNKEINFFSKNFTNGWDWYLSQFPTITDDPEFITGEASPSYFFRRHVPERIYQTAPNTKLIVLLRNPADRSISDYYQNKKTGKVTKTLEEVIIRGIKHSQQMTIDELSHSGGTLFQSLYFLKLQRWLQIFPREQFLILKSEDFFDCPGKIMELVFQFLELPKVINNQYHKLNIGSYPPLEEDIRQKLTEFFHIHNQKLEEYLQIKFNW
ncbi:tetratricopeptide repeat protein,sulfotransferase family protein [Xenococcus sp. PCC 7305]|uniref:tetratricopeptide repeat protein n=1 Tax=Xenococcus sp. PCC 7305 TaxID=102125 RepID=UPI0002AC0F17|nr:tetratricopeptide repeat protein [Xenococcus sp. PCC 7305]ELS05437.1 tetratricopeptide repeat protein,sulfotransferase family protein [Xenococcus sp. PCC 7305]